MGAINEDITTIDEKVMRTRMKRNSKVRVGFLFLRFGNYITSFVSSETLIDYLE